MIIDSKTFTELAVHLRIVSDAILNTARHLTAIGSTNDPSKDNAAWDGTLNSMMSISQQLRVMDRLLYAILDANGDEDGSGSSGGSLPC